MTPPADAARRAAVPWHRRFQSRVLLVVALISGVALAAILIATDRIVAATSLARTTADLAAAESAFDLFVARQTDAAITQTAIKGEDATFRALLEGHDQPTLTQYATDFCDTLKAGICIITDGAGAWTGVAGWPANVPPALAVKAAIAAARTRDASSTLAIIDGGLYLVVAEPERFDVEVLGIVAIGYRLDDRFAAELEGVTHTAVAFVCDRTICGTSLDAAAARALQAAFDAGASGGIDATPALRTVGGARFVGARYPLAANPRTQTPGVATPASLVLLQPWAPTAEALARIRERLLLIGGLTFLAGVVGSLFLSGQVTRPLRRLASVAREIAGGSWSRRAPVEGPAEAQVMAEAFNDMTSSLRLQAGRLQEAFDRFRAVTDSANHAIISIDADSRIVFWSRHAEVVFGYAESDAMGQPLAACAPGLAVAPDLVGRTIEVTARRRDGGDVPCEVSLSSWKAGDAVFVTSIVRDITERKASERAIRQRDDELRQAQKMEAIGRLAGGVAHDFNNLLTAILGYTDLLLEDAPAGSDAAASLGEIQKAGGNAASLTRQLLAFSRRQAVTPTAIDLNATVTRTEKLLRRLIGEDVVLALDLDPEIGRITGDEGHFETVLLNLAVNSRDAMPGGGRLTVRTARRGAEVCLMVTDTGCGMSDDVRARIFEPFFTTKDVGRGTGLGLATVYGIVQQSGGAIDVESRVGEGTTFIITLPGTDRPVNGAAADDSACPIPTGTETVLVVEDDDAVRALASTVLRRLGYRVIEARDGEQGLDAARAHTAVLALILADVVMPVMSGHEMARRLSSEGSRAPIIFTSGYTDAWVRDDRPGDAAFLQKPFSPEQLGRLVRSVIDRRQNARVI